MIEISKEANRDDEKEHDIHSPTKPCRVKCSMAPHNDKTNTMEDDSYECTNMKSPDSAIGNIGSVESFISNTESDFSSTYYASDASPPPSVQHNESPYTEGIRRENIRKVMQYKDHLQGNWKYLKKAVDVGMVHSFEKVGLATEAEFRKLKSHKRSKVADMLVMHIMQRIENATDIMNFENTIGKPVCDKLTTREAKYYRTEEKDQEKNFDSLKLNRQFMIDNFMTDDIENVKDWFVQEFIINIDENDEIINEHGFYERQNTKFNEYFVEKFIINKSYIGSYQCLLEYLELLCKNGSTRLRELLKRLKTDRTNTTDQNVKGPIVSISALPTGYKDMSTERYRSTAGKDLKLNVQFTTNDDIEKNKIYKEVIHKAKTKNGLIGRELGACIDNVYSGSIVIHMVALRRDMIQTVIDKMKNGQFSAVVKLLLNDLKIKRLLPCGKHELEIKCSVGDKQNHFRYIHKSNPIADNKSFLEEEMDTIYVLKELEKHGVQIGINVIDGDREFRARHIMTKALAEKKIARTLYKVLLDGEMVNVKNRLLKYETVYASDASQLQKHIFKHFHEIIRKVFLDDIRHIFTDRNIIKDEMFEAAEKSEERHEVSMANILTEIIKMGTDAMLTLVDALYVIQLDKLADKLMKIELLDDDDHSKTQKKCDPVYINKTIHVESSDTNLLAIGRYELIVKRRKPTNKKRAAGTKRPTVVACTRSRKIAKLESGKVHDRLLYDVRNGPVFCNEEKCLKFPVSASNIDFQNQHPDRGTNYRMTHLLNNRFDNYYTGFQVQSQTTKAEYGNDVQILSNDNTLSEIALPPTSTTFTSDSGSFALLESSGNWHMVSSPASTTGTMDSSYSIKLEADSYKHMICSPASISGTTDSGYSTQLDPECYTHRRRSPTSTTGITDCVYSFQLEADCGYSTQLEADGYTKRVLTPDSMTCNPSGYTHYDEDDRSIDCFFERDIFEKPLPKAWRSNQENKAEFEIDNDLLEKDSCDVNTQEMDVKKKNLTTQPDLQSDNNSTKSVIGNNLLIDDQCSNLLQELVIKKTTTIKTGKPNDEIFPEVELNKT